MRGWWRNEAGFGFRRSGKRSATRHVLAAPVVEPRSGVLIPPQACKMRKKSPHFHASSSLNMAVRGGLTRCARRYSAHPWASPLRGQRKRCSKTLPAFLCGQPTHCVRGLSNWLSPVVEPRSGILIPPAENIKEKSPYFRTSSHLEYGGEGGIDSLRSPCGQPVRCALSLSNWLRQLSNPGRGFSSPHRRATCEKKARIFMRALL